MFTLFHLKYAIIPPASQERGNFMRGKSHRYLGQYLIRHYMNDVPQLFKKAFLIGCVEPDRNPATYLKGSIRCQWLRGHNYRNARRFMRCISLRLEKKENLNVLDYYTLGKLIHYTTDAFTYAHNDTFPTNLADHREYEVALQKHFLRYIEKDPQVDPKVARSIMEAIYSYHREYEELEANIHIDSHFALAACCCVVAVLFPKPIL